ncbi:zinc-ribbon domain-containing protein [Blastopirellula sp. JC732]|uniref:Zinc-ribbon domain-containing protein n=1 Tax=Blastopirellula sediminis TaxID=2894196 RepID=A0A9X1MIJ9_9BACT|nr:zinc-ribbon domain-containing protein [Blastopirellula sediminis]MCC9604422.1 zinc-ribbon domain-containing protein [Blastopirellula sediminis]MCC9626942.1 zinc-ribbon domain-containing protein [Blastopirellula sediminis]
MPIPVCCPQCHQSFQLADKFAGCKIRCPKCGAAEFSVPSLSPGPTATNADAPYRLKPLASADTVGGTASGASDDIPRSALRNGLLISGIVLGVMLLLGGVAVASLFTWGAVARLGAIELPDLGVGDEASAPDEGSFRSTPASQTATREAIVNVRQGEPAPNSPSGNAEDSRMNSSVIVAVPSSPIPGQYSSPNSVPLMTYRGAQHPFEVLLPSQNVLVIPMGVETVYKWVPTGRYGGVLLRIMQFQRMPGESDQQAIQRLEGTRGIGREVYALHGAPIVRAATNVSGYTAVDRKLMGENHLGVISLTVAHPTGIYHFQGIAPRPQMSGADLDTIKNSFRFTQ